MPNIKYSVVIPTRNRLEYLSSCLDSIPFDRRDDIEVIVSENSDEEVTAGVRDMLARRENGAFRYVRPPRAPVGMSANWEFGVAAARGEYTLLIGDDDALMPSIFSVLDCLIEAKRELVYRWSCVAYFWQDFVEESMRGRLAMPLVPHGARSVLELVDGHQRLSEVVDGRVPYYELPMLYNAAIHRDVIGQIFAAGSPHFAAISPDIYSGMAVAYFAKRFVNCVVPLSIAGQAAKANGAAHLVRSGDGRIVRDFQVTNESSGLQVAPLTYKVPTITVGTMDVFERFAEKYPDVRQRFEPNERRLVGRIVRELNGKLISPEEYQSSITALVAHYPKYGALIAEICAEKVGPTPNPWELGYNGSLLTVAASEFGVTDVAGAAALAERILGPAPEKFSFPTASKPTRKERARDLLPPVLYRAASQLRARYL